MGTGHEGNEPPNHTAREASNDALGRLARVSRHALAAGKVVAQVTGTSPTPYRVVIELTQPSDAAWQSAFAVMATQAHSRRSS
ncbi:MAG: hypothetical protein RL685_1823 [Pseudomonadota bacterium]|jgi:uncharacterized Zn finger protein